MHRWRPEEVKQEKKLGQEHQKEEKGQAVKDRSRPTVKERNLSVPQHLLESASVATAWLTTGTVYFQKTVICGYQNLELDPLRKERKKLTWNWYKKIQDKHQNDVPRRCRSWMNKY